MEIRLEWKFWDYWTYARYLYLFHYQCLSGYPTGSLALPIIAVLYPMRSDKAEGAVLPTHGTRRIGRDL